MKNLTKTVFASILTAVVFTSTAFNTFAAEPVTPAKTMVATATGFNKIWVSGNVKIVLTQGDKESIKGGVNYDTEKTTVMSKGQTLYINSLESSQVTINITVKDLQRVEAYGQSVVVTSNKFDVKYLQLFLSQNATAKINAVAGSFYTEVKDNAVLKISGIAHESTVIASNLNNVKFDNFASIRPSQFVEEGMLTATQSAVAVLK